MKIISTPKKILFTVITLIVFFHLLEIGLRLYQYQRYSIPVFSESKRTIISNPLMHYILNPEKPFHTSDYFRATDNADSAKRHIVCMGGSSTYGIKVSANESYPNQLQNFLNKDGETYKVLNAGVPGWSLPHHISRYVFDLRNRQPRINMVVLYIGYNDVWTSITGGDSLIGHSDRLKTLSDNMTPWMSYRFLMWLFLKMERVTGINIVSNNLNDYAFKEEAGSGRINEANVMRFQNEFSLFLKIMKMDNIHILVVLQDTNGDFSLPQRKKAFFLLKEEIGNIARDLNVPTVDMHDVTQSKKQYFADVIHMTKEGNQVRAGYMANVINEIFQASAFQ